MSQRLFLNLERWWYPLSRSRGVGQREPFVPRKKEEDSLGLDLSPSSERNRILGLQMKSQVQTGLWNLEKKKVCPSAVCLLGDTQEYR